MLIILLVGGPLLLAPFENSPLTSGSLNCCLVALWSNFQCSPNSIVFLLPCTCLPDISSPMLPAPLPFQTHSPGSLKSHTEQHFCSLNTRPITLHILTFTLFEMENSSMQVNLFGPLRAVCPCPITPNSPLLLSLF